MSTVGGKAVSTEMVLFSLNSTCYLEISKHLTSTNEYSCTHYS